MQELPEGFEETFGPSIRAYLLDVHAPCDRDRSFHGIVTGHSTAS